nr:immunoglobulin light chain junction region [Macaca mulatta]
CMQVLEFPWSF